MKKQKKKRNFTCQFERVCVICGKKYVAKKSNSKTCSGTCRCKLSDKNKTLAVIDETLSVANDLFHHEEGKEITKDEWLVRLDILRKKAKISLGL